MTQASDQQPLDGLAVNKVKFVGMAISGLDDLPQIGDLVTFLVEARCTARGDEEKGGGEIRPVARMHVLSMAPQGPPRKPENTPALFDAGSQGGD